MQKETRYHVKVKDITLCVCPSQERANYWAQLAKDEGIRDVTIAVIQQTTIHLGFLDMVGV